MPVKRPDQLDTRAPLSTDWMIITPTGGPAFKCTVSAIGAGVTSLNQLVGATAGALLTGAVVLKQGTNVTLTTSGQEITIASTATAGGVTSLNALAGALSVVAGANVTVTATGTSITVASTDTVGVPSVNGITNAVTLAAGANITITPSGSTLTIASTASGGAQTINPQTGTTYTFVLADAQALVTLNNAAAITVTVPLNSSVAFPTGTGIDLIQLGAGQVTVAAAGGVTLNSTPGLKMRIQYSGGSLIKIGTDSWVLVGDTTV